jgi:hypothetical protein
MNHSSVSVFDGPQVIDEIEAIASLGHRSRLAFLDVSRIMVSSDVVRLVEW